MRRSIVTIVVLAVAAGSVHADEALEQLIRNAKYWEERGRDDKAVEAWKRVLLADAGNPEALVWLGTHDARAGRFDGARAMLARLRAAHPGDPGIARLEQALATGSSYDEILGHAREQARAGHADEAVALYRQAFRSDDPPDELALEYYQTLGGTASGWEAARDGLAKVAARAGAGSRAQLAYAQHLSYRESTRRQAIGLLKDLAHDPTLGEQARAAWRQALVWLAGGPGDVDLYDSFLAVVPGDADIRQRQDEARRAAPPAHHAAPNAAQAGFAALDRSDPAEAERIFDKASKEKGKKGDPELLTGMGVVALKQQEFPRAKEIFERVKAMAPDRPELWDHSLRSATFWTLFGEAQARRKEGRLPEAEVKLQEAITVSPEEAVHARVELANVMIERGATVEGEALLREVLAQNADDVGALRSLAHIVAVSGRADEALALNSRLDTVAPEQAWKHGELEAEALRASAARKARDVPEEARDMLTAAREADPKNVWVLHDLAGLLLDMDEPEQAQQIIDDLTKLDPQLPGLLLLRVRQMEAEGNIEAALQLMEGSPRVTDENWRATRARLDVQVQIAQIVARARRGAVTASRLHLLELQKRVQSTPEFLVPVALAWADLGDNERAVALATEARGRLTDGRPGLRLELAAVYLRAGRDSELDAMLRDLAFDPTLSQRERNDLSRMQVAYAIRSADKLREAGELESAVSRLAPMLHDHPDESKLLCALGRVYNDAGDFIEGYKLFRKVLDRFPDDLEARQGAIQTALGSYNRSTAQDLADDGLRRAPNDPRMYLIAGRFDVMIGEEDDALHAFEHAKTLAESRGPALGADLLAANPEGSPSLHAEAVRHADDRMDSGEGNLVPEIQTEIDRLEAKMAVDVDATFQIRNRNGYGGFGGLTDLGATVEANIPLSFSSRLKLTAEPVLIDSESVDLSDPAVSQTLGTYGLNPGAVPAEAFSRTASGARLGLAYSRPWLNVDIGSTVLGVPLTTIVGGVTLRQKFGRLGVALDASRRSIDESYLSLIGIRDPLTGITWGRMLRDGARLDLALSTDSATVYAIGSYARVEGENVPTNGNWMGGAGVEWKFYDWDEQKIVGGLALTYLGFDQNLRYFTLGQGGYFSPQQFLHAGIPVSWRGHVGALHWEAKADVGINWFREDDSNFFPANADLQLQREMQRDANGQPVLAVYPGQTTISGALNLSAKAGYQVAPDIEAGAQVSWQSADWFREVVGGVYVQLQFNKKKAPRSTL